MKEMKELDDLDVLRQMYATLCGGIDRSLTLLETGNVWEVRRVLQQALDIAEELYIAGMSTEDELAALRTQRGER